MNMQGYLEQQISVLTPPPNPTPPVNNNPKIIFVNGHWQKIFGPLNAGPSQGGQGYWFDGTSFFNAAAAYFNLTTWENLFADGSSKIGIDSSGSDRKTKGNTFAQNNYTYLTSSSSSSLHYYLVGHSEGCAFAAGIAEYLKSHGHTVHEMVFLSCDEGDEFSVDNTIPTYQVVLSYWDTDFWTGDKEIEIDWVVGDHRVSGTTKYGVVLGSYSALSVHGSTNSQYVFNKVADLKSVYLTQNWNGNGDIFYSQSTPPHNTKFYSVERTFIAPNHPAWNTTTLTIDE